MADRPWSMFDEPNPDGTVSPAVVEPPPLPVHAEPPSVPDGARISYWTWEMDARLYDDASYMLQDFGAIVWLGHEHVPLWIEAWNVNPRRNTVVVKLWTYTYDAEFSVRRGDYLLLRDDRILVPATQETSYAFGYRYTKGVVYGRAKTKEQYEDAHRNTNSRAV